MTAEEINRRVAKALGMRVNIFDGGKMVDTWWKWDMGFLGISGLYWRDEPQDYCTSAFGADLLKAHMRAKGWHYRSGWGTDGGFAYVDSREPDYRIGEAYGQESEEMALCLAFLAACEASKEVE